MTLQQLHYAITVANAGSLNKAAELLYVSQPSLSGAIKKLEAELGITIFTRSGKGIALTNDGSEFIAYARQLYEEYESIMGKYGVRGNLKKKFGVSTQHYTFAVKAFVEMAKQFNMSEYEFAIRETKTREVISDVSTQRSEIGILYFSNFNRTAIRKILKSNELEYHKLIDCGAYVYLWKGHPLADRPFIRMQDLDDYPCLSFEQGDNASLYYAEELYSMREYPRIIKCNDRATVLNFMVGLNGYTICSGIICEELNGSDYIAVPLKTGKGSPSKDEMEIGYIIKKDRPLSRTGEMYIEEIQKYLKGTGR
ncbi:MAG: LysR family transcriptional regulator [Lachnospiraceae bacterium]|nr:LysR family transcriptional regulator [Lachnospiraceae bacterium]